MDHVHFLNYRGSCKKAGKEAVAEVKAQVLEWPWKKKKTFEWPKLGHIAECWLEHFEQFINIQEAV